MHDAGKLFLVAKIVLINIIEKIKRNRISYVTAQSERIISE